MKITETINSVLVEWERTPVKKQGSTSTPASAQSSIQSLDKKANISPLKSVAKFFKTLISKLLQVIDRMRAYFGHRVKENTPLFANAQVEIEEESAAPLTLETPLSSVSPFETPSVSRFETPPSVSPFETLRQLNHSEKQKLTWLIGVLAENDASWLLENKKEIRRVGSDIGKAPSLRLIEYILRRPKLLETLRAIPQRWFIGAQIWAQCVPILGEGFNNDLNSLTFEAELQDFSQKYQLDFNKMNGLLKSRNWDAFLKYIFKVN